MSKQNELAQFADVVTVNSGKVGIGTSSPTVLLDLESASPIIRLTDSDASGTPECQVSGAGGDLIFDADRDNEKASSLMAFKVDGSERMRIDATGAVTMPHQPAFLVKPNTEQSNIALASNVTVLFQTEIFDQNADFANNTFTAPVAGKYQLNFSLYLKDINDAYQYIYARIQTSNRNYEVEIYPSTIFNSDGRITIGAGFLADMDASDTAFVTVQVPNTGSAQMDIVVYSSFSGYLVA